MEQIPGMISNPYHPPAPGYDDPHAGIDLADRMAGSQVALQGKAVQAALSGRVAMIVHDRFPFGNALVIETPLEDLPADWWPAANIPTPAPTLAPRSALTCPANLQTEMGASAAPGGRRSLYTLYAHLQSTPAAWQLGDQVACGQSIGAIGETGNALNPHLHFETRVGPAGMQMPGMSHYDSGARPEEMAAYCLWSVSGLFQLVDPQAVLALPAAQPGAP
jgi:murein DD-endopeptidase MepM/ murein hydrolase activator NlpD